MSYSFSIRAATMAAAVAAVAVKMNEVVAQQPIHDADRDTAIGNVASMLAVVGEPPEGLELSVQVNGWVSYTIPDHTITGASCSVSVSHVEPATT